MPRHISTAVLCTAIAAGCATAERSPHPTPVPRSSPLIDPYDSGGALLPEQASYDVTYYDLAVGVDPGTRSIRGRVLVRARVGSPIAWFVLDLDPILSIDSVTLREPPRDRGLDYERRGGRLWIALPGTRQPGSEIAVEIAYGGSPRVAPNPPWEGGFTWKTTASGAAWIATSCQGAGADVWWPVKDHVSDEPDSMDIHITVPEPLVAASNGRLREVEQNDDGTRTYHWHVSTPINAYNVALNIAPYETIERDFTSVAGDTFPVVFYVLPEDLEKGKVLFEEILDHLRFYEATVGPYPFRADKYGVAQTPHLGMEHQTIIAYGANFERGAMTHGRDFGFDVLHHHELSHEWWGNLVTNLDWSDMWIHEGFGSYMQPLYLEQTRGIDAYREYLDSILPRIRNRIAVAPEPPVSSQGVFGGDIYFKGAWVLHTLRFLVGEELFRKALRRMAYPSAELERVTDGRQCRFATTDDFVRLVEELTGEELSWFFELYVRQPELPRLEVTRRERDVTLRWVVPDGLAFPMPIDVRVGDETRRLPVTCDGTTIATPDGEEVEIDPERRVLRAGLLERRRRSRNRSRRDPAQ